MDIANLFNVLDSVDVTNENSVELNFVYHKDNRFIRYRGESGESLRKGLLDMYRTLLDTEDTIDTSKGLPYEEARLVRKKQTEYNPVSSNDSSAIEKITNLATANIDEVIDHLESTYRDLTELDLNEATYYYTKLENNNEEIFLFTSLTKQKKLVSGIHGYITGNEFKKLEDNQFTLNQKIDAIIFENEVLVFHRGALDKIFSLFSYYKKQTEEALNSIYDAEIVDDFDAFKRDCLMDGRSMRRLTRLNTLSGLLDEFTEHFDNIQEVINKAKLTIKLEDGKLTYDGTSKQRNEILSCMSDSWYVSILLKHVGEDILVNQKGR